MNVAEVVVSVNKSKDIVLPGPDNVDFSPRELRVFLAACKSFAFMNEIDLAYLPPIRVMGDLTEVVDGLSFDQVLREFVDLPTLNSVDLTKQVLETVKRARNAQEIKLVGTSTNHKYQVELDKLQGNGQRTSSKDTQVELVYDESDEKVFATFVSESLTNRDVCALFMTKEYAEKARNVILERFRRRGVNDKAATQFANDHIFVITDILLTEVNDKPRLSSRSAPATE
jgi:hypothetical protein